MADVSFAAGWLSARLGTTTSTATGGQPRVAVCLADPADQLIWALAADRIGITAALLDVRWPLGQLAQALDQVAPDLLVDHRPPRDARETAATGTELAGDYPEGDWISLTSGTSGAPRALLRSRASWTASFPAFSRLTGVRAGDTVLVPGTLCSSMFAFAAFHALSVGASVRLLPRWRPILADAAAITVAHLVPTMLADLLEDPRVCGVRPRVAILAGATLAAELHARACTGWPETLLVEYYGSSEQSFVTARAGGAPGTVGRPFPGTQMQIRDEAGHPVRPGAPGVIWTRSRYAAKGYADGAPGPFQQVAGWVSVGDRGRVDSSGVLTLLGRDQITTGGTTVDPAAIEAVLRGAEGVREVVVLGMAHSRLGEVVAAVVECRSGCSLSSLRRYAREHLASGHRPRRWYAVEQLPRTGGGKPARADVRAAVEEGRMLPLS